MISEWRIGELVMLVELPDDDEPTINDDGSATAKGIILDVLAPPDARERFLRHVRGESETA